MGDDARQLAYSLNQLPPTQKLAGNGHKQSRIDELLPWNYSGRTNG